MEIGLFPYDFGLFITWFHMVSYWDAQYIVQLRIF